MHSHERQVSITATTYRLHPLDNVLQYPSHDHGFATAHDDNDDDNSDSDAGADDGNLPCRTRSSNIRSIRRRIPPIPTDTSEAHLQSSLHVSPLPTAHGTNKRGRTAGPSPSSSTACRGKPNVSKPDTEYAAHHTNDTNYMTPHHIPLASHRITIPTGCDRSSARRCPADAHTLDHDDCTTSDTPNPLLAILRPDLVSLPPTRSNSETPARKRLTTTTTDTTYRSSADNASDALRIRDDALPTLRRYNVTNFPSQLEESVQARANTHDAAAATVFHSPYVADLFHHNLRLQTISNTFFHPPLSPDPSRMPSTRPNTVTVCSSPIAARACAASTSATTILKPTPYQAMLPFIKPSHYHQPTCYAHLDLVVLSEHLNHASCPALFINQLTLLMSHIKRQVAHHCLTRSHPKTRSPFARPTLGHRTHRGVSLVTTCTSAVPRQLSSGGTSTTNT